MKKCCECNRPADIEVHDEYFCMNHYEIYHQNQSEALLPFKFIVQTEPPEPKQKTKKKPFDWSMLIDK